jgi:hypothetical protein
LLYFKKGSENRIFNTIQAKSLKPKKSLHISLTRKTFLYLCIVKLKTMQTLTMEYNTQNVVVRQIFNDLPATHAFCFKDKKDEFNCDLKRAISGDELMNRLSTKIYKMFENESVLSS